MRDSKTAVTDTRKHFESSLNVNLEPDEVLATAEKKQNYMGSTQQPDAFKNAAKQSFVTSQSRKKLVSDRSTIMVYNGRKSSIESRIS